jgi:low affinity Fe/Cu permease
MSFDGVATWATKAVGHWAALPVTSLAIGPLYWLGGVDIANITISILSLFLLILLQHSSNRDGEAIQVKLDEILRAVPEASNRLIGLDLKPEEEIKQERT